ncbi:ketopantoate hydroxymethyltransferase [Gemmobacter caeni]|jgi:3-methyl-2-oxobutanoate hydroxymethyltransferase|uniref:3-methyl-2-oxobutanoate hydroxymethyltransferase n=2 Tax=Gemmobacter TaxID=204456 RepID=A0A2T6B1U6_9RHOB|nr:MULTISPECIES: 3-methyl-2-oxobutanoate hydroxymethyltransferase [Gemmobacter]PTX50041.1 ketopantoate hydroxymethyltransferase [Gemmobacter caeni]TWJ01936.1 ketopantoate hydroxymethyltransferase [Gemmobacter caeni]GHC21636.1 3-methyl-2-oxobutanoate hydroxymethyltransferase [Gemmobacter nanjingensis]
MSASSPLRPVLPADIQSRKGGTPLVVLTAYTTPMARIVDRHCDVALVGDSLGMVLHGLPSTIGVTMDMMILHGRAVVRGLTKAMAVIDMPFGSYEESPQQAFRNAARLIAETGAPAVKLEGGQHMAETIAFLTSRGVPVMAHIGLTPQAVNTLGGYKVVGRDAEAEKVMADAVAVQEAGAFSVVLEKVPEGLASRITQRLTIPTIGIGAGVRCDGQVLVVDDMLGMFTDFRPKFVKRFANFGETADEAVAAYAAEVRDRAFPGPEHAFADVLPAKGAQG